MPLPGLRRDGPDAAHRVHLLGRAGRHGGGAGHHLPAAARQARPGAHRHPRRRGGRAQFRGAGRPGQDAGVRGGRRPAAAPRARCWRSASSACSRARCSACSGPRRWRSRRSSAGWARSRDRSSAPSVYMVLQQTLASYNAWYLIMLGPGGDLRGAVRAARAVGPGGRSHATCGCSRSDTGCGRRRAPAGAGHANAGSGRAGQAGTAKSWRVRRRRLGRAPRPDDLHLSGWGLGGGRMGACCLVRSQRCRGRWRGPAPGWRRSSCWPPRCARPGRSRCRSPWPTCRVSCRSGRSASAGPRCATGPPRPPAPTLTVSEVDSAFERDRRGVRARVRRPRASALVGELFGRATADEQRFLVGLLVRRAAPGRAGGRDDRGRRPGRRRAGRPRSAGR